MNGDLAPAKGCLFGLLFSLLLWGLLALAYHFLF